MKWTNAEDRVFYSKITGYFSANWVKQIKSPRENVWYALMRVIMDDRISVTWFLFIYYTIQIPAFYLYTN